MRGQPQWPGAKGCRFREVREERKVMVPIPEKTASRLGARLWVALGFACLVIRAARPASTFRRLDREGTPCARCQSRRYLERSLFEEHSHGGCSFVPSFSTRRQ